MGLKLQLTNFEGYNLAHNNSYVEKLAVDLGRDVERQREDIKHTAPPRMFTSAAGNNLGAGIIILITSY